MRCTRSRAWSREPSALLDQAMYSGVSPAYFGTHPIPYWVDKFPDAAGTGAQDNRDLAYNVTQSIYSVPNQGWQAFPGGEEGSMFVMAEYYDLGRGGKVSAKAEA